MFKVFLKIPVNIKGKETGCDRVLIGDHLMDKLNVD